MATRPGSAVSNMRRGRLKRARPLTAQISEPAFLQSREATGAWCITTRRRFRGKEFGRGHDSRGLISSAVIKAHADHRLAGPRLRSEHSAPAMAQRAELAAA